MKWIAFGTALLLAVTAPSLALHALATKGARIGCLIVWNSGDRDLDVHIGTDGVWVVPRGTMTMPQKGTGSNLLAVDEETVLWAHSETTGASPKIALGQDSKALYGKLARTGCTPGAWIKEFD